MRPKAIDDETLARIAEDIRTGVFDIKGAAAHYGVAAPTLYRRLQKLPGDIKAQRKANAISEIGDYCAKNGINIPLLKTAHQKMLAMDMVRDKFDAADLCAAFGVSMDSYTKHQKIVAKGPNSHKQREAKFESMLRSVFQVLGTLMPGVEACVTPTQLSKMLSAKGIKTSPQMMRRILNNINKNRDASSSSTSK